MSDYPKGDTFLDHAVTSVEPWNGGGWSLKFENGWCFGCPADSPVVPKPGMTARLYGKGIGYTVRGLFLDGRKVFYRTEAEDRAKNEAEQVEADKALQYDLDRDKADRNRRWANLPGPFRERGQWFAGRTPHWRRDHETYELFVCEQAYLIAKTLKTPKAIREWYALPWGEQVAVVPVDGGHSGNTMGCAVHLAVLLLTQPDLVPKAHGALCPLVGCEGYGCHAGSPR